ncbi:MAG: nucleotidyltransferase domain-containing protein [Bacteroidia bacterium]|nr:nucleotidyltransferase domain-containing protein [Bacteroidia bacterium]
MPKYGSGVERVTLREKEVHDKIVKILQDLLRPQRIILFGSRGKDRARQGSDFDFAVDMTRPDEKLEREVKECVDGVLGLYSADIVYLGSVEPDFRDLILKTGRIVYERRS